MSLPKVVLMDDRRGVSVGQRVFVAEPLDPIFESCDAGSVVEMAKPLVKRSSGRVGDPSDQCLVRFFGVV
jgi:hypothetical protein